jgi:phosphoserine phosphatase
MTRTIAIIFDFDGTLAPDSTTSFLASLGIDTRRFWQDEVQALLADGWDEMPAYLWKMIEWSQGRPAEERITREKLQRWGERIEFYPGVESLFEELRAEARAAAPSSNVEYYLISSGIGEVLRATRIASQFRDIWASDFHYNEAGEIVCARNVVSFTEKTRFIVQISKGIVGPEARGRNKDVNKRIRSGEFAVPFRNMIVVGDGDTDIPMFAMIGRKDLEGRAGVPIGVSDPKQPDKWGRALDMARDRRVFTVHPADYSENSALRATLIDAVRRVAEGLEI